MSNRSLWHWRAALVGCALCACTSTPYHHETPPKSTQSPAAAHPQEASTKPPATSTSVSVPLSLAEQKFLQDATTVGAYELEIARIAVQKDAATLQREFAQQMIEAHTKSDAELREMAHRKGVKLNSNLGDEDKTKLDALRELDGQAFVAEFYRLQVDAHDRAIESYETAARDCTDPELKSFVARTLPTLREHRQALDDHPVKD